eukprot:GSMAST32.ASY1.ANO1.2266.1 assembled CDS
MLKLTVFILFFLCSDIEAVCPNSCSGHGKCDAQDICTCFNEGKPLYFTKDYDPTAGNQPHYDNYGSANVPMKKRWTGADCSLHTCPRGISWTQGVVASDSTSGTCYKHTYCSGRGMCDYSTGQCVCFAGYSGNDCANIEALA